MNPAEREPEYANPLFDGAELTRRRVFYNNYTID